MKRDFLMPILFVSILMAITFTGCTGGTGQGGAETTSEPKAAELPSDFPDGADILNEVDSTPLVLIDPVTYAPPPLELAVENTAVEAFSDEMIIRIYVNEKPSDFDKIPDDVIFKCKPVQHNAQSPYKTGDRIPVIYNMVDGNSLESDLVVMGTVAFKGNKYALAEQICTIEIPSDGHTYVPGSSEVKVQVYLPHKGEEYWLVVWNSREIHSMNIPKYLIQAEGLEAITEGLYKEGE